MSDEIKFYKYLASKLPGQVQRIESIGAGIPDVMVCSEGKTIWMELKVTLHSDDKVLLRPAQYAWGMQHSCGGGGKCFVVAWRQKDDMVLVWKFSDVSVSVYGKYLEIVNKPKRIFPRKLHNWLIQFLFE